MAHNFNFAPSNAHLRLYKRLYLWDKSVTPRIGIASAYLGDIRLGMPPFHCQLNVGIDGGRMPKILATSGGRWISGHLPLESSKENFWNIIGACHSMTLARDKALLRSRQHVPLTAGMGIRAGKAIAAGSYVNRDRYV